MSDLETESGVAGVELLDQRANREHEIHPRVAVGNGIDVQTVDPLPFSFQRLERCERQPAH